MIWEKVGVPTELIIVRADDVTPIKINIVFVEATLNQIYRSVLFFLYIPLCDGGKLNTNIAICEYVSTDLLLQLACE